MCTPTSGLIEPATNAFSGLFSVVKGTGQVISGISQYKNNKANYAYQTQIALNNAKIAQNEALRQKQLGLEKSRLEKISTLQEVNKLKAKNASHGLDLMSSTNQMAYEDVWNLGDLNSDLIKKEYDYNANSYFNQANSHLNQANNYKKQYKQSVFDYSLNALGKIGQVASEWYENREKGGLENGFF